MLSTLRRGLQSPIRLTIPPGTRPEIVARLAGRVMYFDEEDMLAALRNAELAPNSGRLDLTVRIHASGVIRLLLAHPRETVVRRVKQHFRPVLRAGDHGGAAERNLTRKTS
jgi:UPF0755 protein